jgi:hypothetical protein
VNVGWANVAEPAALFGSIVLWRTWVLATIVEPGAGIGWQTVDRLI